MTSVPHKGYKRGDRMRTKREKQAAAEAQEPRRHMWTFEPDEDVFLAMEEEMRINPHAWKTRSELINECIREALATSVADAIERKMITQKIAELKARAEALKEYSARRAQATQGIAEERAFAEAKAALRNIYKRKLD